jgi:hypothetical protein
LDLAFPRRVVSGVVAPHECDECDALRRQLQHVTWESVPAGFVHANSGALPLLSSEAYAALLPAWLLQALRQPDSEVAAMLLINLGDEPDTSAFTAEQAGAIVEVARYVVAHSYWGPNDPDNVESLAAIEAAWSAGA